MVVLDKFSPSDVGLTLVDTIARPKWNDVEMTFTLRRQKVNPRFPNKTQIIAYDKRLDSTNNLQCTFPKRLGGDICKSPNKVECGARNLQ